MKDFARITIVIIATLMCLGVSPAYSGTLRIAFSEHPPAKVYDKAGAPAGIDTELARHLAKELGFEVEFIEVPFKRGLFMLEHGVADLMTGILRRPEREEYLHYITPPYRNYSNKAFFVLKGKEKTITQQSDLHDIHVSTKLGASYYPEFDNDPNIDKDPVAKEQNSFHMLLAGRVDAVIITESAGDYHVAKMGLQNQIAKADYAFREKQEVYMVLSKKSPHAHRLSEFQTIMDRIVKSNIRNQIKAKFYKALRQ